MVCGLCTLAHMRCFWNVASPLPGEFGPHAASHCQHPWVPTLGVSTAGRCRSHGISALFWWRGLDARSPLGLVPVADNQYISLRGPGGLAGRCQNRLLRGWAAHRGPCPGVCMDTRPEHRPQTPCHRRSRCLLFACARSTEHCPVFSPKSFISYV